MMSFPIVSLMRPYLGDMKKWRDKTNTNTNDSSSPYTFVFGIGIDFIHPKFFVSSRRGRRYRD